LDEGDNDLTRFLIYVVSALQMIEPDLGKGTLSILRSPQLPPVEGILTTLLNEITTRPDQIVLVLDDYHMIESQSIHTALAFLIRPIYYPHVAL
jgi:LuxR family maltose regulon positive regulatory protein